MPLRLIDLHLIFRRMILVCDDLRHFHQSPVGGRYRRLMALEPSCWVLLSHANNQWIAPSRSPFGKDIAYAISFKHNHAFDATRKMKFGLWCDGAISTLNSLNIWFVSKRSFYVGLKITMWTNLTTLKGKPSFLPEAHVFVYVAVVVVFNSFAFLPASFLSWVRLFLSMACLPPLLTRKSIIVLLRYFNAALTILWI